jgi:Transposase and inactivated derivatives
MLKNKRESLSHVPMKRLKENLEYYDELIRKIEKSIKELEKEIKELSKKNFQEEYKLLKSIPDVSDRVIGVVIAMFGGFKRFKSVKEAASYAGLNPSPYESGTSVKKSGSIKKMGNPYARKILYMAALSAIRFNKYCRELYKRLVSKGKAKKLALVAVAHKLLRQAYGVLKNRRPFDENFCT